MTSKPMEEVTFSDLIDDGSLEIGDGYRAKNSELGGEGLIFLRAGHVTDTHIDFSGADRFRRDLESRVRSKLAKAGDAVVTTKGNSTGRTTFVTQSMPPFVYSPHLSYWRSKNPDRIEGGFLRYWSKGPEFTHQLGGMKASTDMAPYLSLVDQKRLRISLPPIEEQRAIAHILGTLDDKIEVNRRMNETLEAMARALFKSWFVDFDPVHAKAEGRDPGLPKHVADLFPDRFVDSELGEIPEGWEVKPLLEVARLISGGTPKTSVAGYWDGDISWASAKDVSQCGETFLIGTERRITHLGLEKSSARLVPAMSTVVVARGATTGRFTMLGYEMAMNQTCYALHSDTGHHLWLSNVFANVVGFLTNAAHGSVFDTITTRTLDAASILDPGRELKNAFESFVEPTYRRLLKGLTESRTLSALRDTLLPSLISGELRVSDAQPAKVSEGCAASDGDS